MKTICSFILVGSVFLMSACNKDIDDQTLNYPALQPLRSDSNAGTWKPILLSSASEFSCAAPIATTSPDYRLQLNEIKSYQANIGRKDRELVDFWSAGAVLRWNEIMRELVAKHNVPPGQNPDGTYPLPNANNPLAYPTFPFSNPPYAARAYAYLSTAQYDACIAAYHYKKQYNRAAPFVVDNTIQSLIPKSTLPSYPSEDAVVMGASVAILKLLFPGDQDYINLKAEEHKRARLLSGANVRSDIDAGESLGLAVASKFIGRARNDKAGAAVGTAAIWAAQKQNCISRGEVPWESLETPQRPGMLTLFGKVSAWHFDSATLVNAVRPPAPPSTQSPAFAAEVEEVYQISKNLTKDQLAIAHFWADGISTYTPPGHWNYIAASDFVSGRFSEARWARNMALLNMGLMDAAIACWEAKYHYYSPRPSQIDARIKTVTGVPNFPSYLSGHSSFSGAAASILGYIVPAKSAEYERLAAEASLSRLYGAIHYRKDCTEGIELGKRIGVYVIARGRADGAE